MTHGLEPLAAPVDAPDAIQLSIAISLKRIADALEDQNDLASRVVGNFYPEEAE